jgi:hypothetical protein
MQLQQLLEQMRHLPELPGVLRPAQPPAWTEQLMLHARPLNMAAFRRVLADIFVTHTEVSSTIKGSAFDMHVRESRFVDRMPEVILTGVCSFMSATKISAWL